MKSQIRRLRWKIALINVAMGTVIALTIVAAVMEIRALLF